MNGVSVGVRGNVKGVSRLMTVTEGKGTRMSDEKFCTVQGVEEVDRLCLLKHSDASLPGNDLKFNTHKNVQRNKGKNKKSSDRGHPDRDPRDAGSGPSRKQPAGVLPNIVLGSLWSVFTRLLEVTATTRVRSAGAAWWTGRLKP
ncbi:hypothetical protein BaRGS_00010467 [Batillaria attramentaria]|uniref:Uncharacterized protein n=1 Tax=Batillaria attramentaria TaxID=370345 RepID=A0ABD0LGN5_9CAEN